MKSINVLLICFVLIVAPFAGKAQLFFQEDFEQGVPIDWSQQFVTSTASWYRQTGGLNGEHPDSAYSGNYNVILQQSGSSKITRLITPLIDLSDAVKAQLRFGLAMTEYVGVDELTVECRAHPDSVWVTLAYFQAVVPIWTEIEIQIPDSLATHTTAISFKGRTNYGGGICVDKVEIVESGLVFLFVKNVLASNFAYQNVPSGSNDNPILRTIVNVVGNTGSLELTDINFVSKNTDDTDIVNGGLSLYYSKDTLFSDIVLLASGKDFVSGRVHFSGLTRSLSFGQNVFWLTYNLTNQNARSRHNHVLDAKIESDAIVVYGSTYPYDDLDPKGHQLYKEALYFDNFEMALPWTVTGDFEIGPPLGKGTASSANSDPSKGVSGVNVLGNDLSDDGLYENDLPELACVAESKYVNIDYYKELSVNFWRWLNVDFFDDVSIGARRNANNWGNVWVNNNYNRDNYWSAYNYTIHDSLSYRDSLQIRFTLGPTDEENNQSGWNIDNFAILGNYISHDIGVIALLEPFDGCGHSAETPLRVRLKNYGGESIPVGIPIRYSINGKSWVTEVAPVAIPLGGVVEYTFAQTADLSIPGAYSIRIETALVTDEVASNNRFARTVNVSPTYGLPYAQSFENGAGFWKSGGQNSTWMLRRPSQAITFPYINSAYNGQFCWVTNFEGSYQANDSSFLQSPCFDLSANVAPILEFAIFTDFQTGVDGANVKYSTDNGVSWHLLPANAQYNQDWYSNAYVTSLDNPGWDWENSGWRIVRNLIPDFLLTESAVKFRIVVESDNAVENEGIAIDMVRIYEAPFDVAISALNYPNTACEIGTDIIPEIELRNDGVASISSGTNIPVSVYFNNQFVKTDNVQLTAALEPGNTALYDIDAMFYMDTVGTYNFRFINKFDTHPGFYGTAQDTLVEDVSVTGMPHYNPFTDVTGKKDGFFAELDAGVGYATYNWSNGSTGQTYIAFVEGTYSVTVTAPNGCTASDETLVVNSIDDIELIEIVTVVPDECVRTASVNYEIKIANRSENSFAMGAHISVGFQVEGQPKVIENITLPAEFGVNDTISYTFLNAVDLSEPANYKLFIFSSMPKDLDKSNDTLIVYPNTWGIPEVAFLDDTIYTARVDTLVLDAGSGMDSYIWGNASTSQTFDVVSNVSQWYYVTVNDVHGCGPTSDSVFVHTDDIGLELIFSPTTACENAADEQIVLSLQNYSGNVLPAGTIIPIHVQINDGAIVPENYELINALGGNVSTSITLETPYNFADTGSYKICAWIHSFSDNNPLNDTVHSNIRTKGYPDVDLLYDTIFTLNPDTLFFDAGTQFDAYMWHNGAITPYFEPDMDTSFVYAVTVTNNDGCGYDSDSVQVFTYNLELSDIVSPVNSCELSSDQKFKLRIKNNGPDKLYPGHQYTLAYRVDGGSWILQPFTINSIVNAGSDFVKELTIGSDMSAFRRYSIEAALSFEYDASRGNDSIAKTIETFGYPEFEFNYPFINSTQPDTTTLIVTPPDYVNYLWNVGINNDTLSLDTLSEPYYSIRVSDVQGCFTADTVWVNSKNIAVGAILAPVDACQHSTSESVKVRLYNMGTDTVPGGSSIQMILNTPVVANEMLNLTVPLNPGDSIDYTFTRTIDLSSTGLHSIDVSISADFDAATSDNDFSSVVETFGSADIELGNEITINELPYVLDAGSTYQSYLWHDGSTESTFEINETNLTGSGLYSVVVVNALGCEGADSRKVNVDIIDWAAQAITSPQSGCAQGESLEVIALISNESPVVVRQGRTFYIAYTLNGGNQIEEILTLSDSVHPLQTLQYVFNEEIDVEANVSNVIELRLTNGGDIDNTNNAVNQTFTIFEPSVEFSQDSVKPESFPYTLNAPNGFVSYVWTTGATGQSIVVTQPGWYTVDAYDENGCFDTDSIYVDNPIGIFDSESVRSLVVFPNPAKDELHIVLDNTFVGRIEIEMVDMQGSIRYSSELEVTDNNELVIDVAEYNQGLYLVRIISERYHKTATVVIQR